MHGIILLERAMNHSLRNLLLAIGLFAIALAFCISTSASVNVFACALGLAVLPALWMLTGKAELFFAAAYPLTICLFTSGDQLRGPVGILVWLALIRSSDTIPLLLLCVLMLLPAISLCLAAFYRPLSIPLSIGVWLGIVSVFLIFIKNPSLGPAEYFTYLPAGVVLVLHAATMMRSHRRQTLSTND